MGPTSNNAGLARFRSPFLNPASGSTRLPSPEKVRDVGLRSWTRQPRPHGLRRSLQSRGTRLGSAPDLGSKTHACINPSAFTIRTDGLLANWTWSFDGNGHVRLVDIKLGTPHSAPSTSLEHQLRFYAWLWHETHGGDIVDGMEGWYLEAGERVGSPPRRDDMVELTTTYQAHYKAMQSHDVGVMAFPAPAETACDGEAAGCGWCSVARTDDGAWSVPSDSNGFAHCLRFA